MHWSPSPSSDSRPTAIAATLIALVGGWLPQALRLPLRVRVHDTVIEQLTVVRGGEPREASQLAFDGEAGWQSWTLKVGARDTPFGKLDGNLEIGASPPYRVDGRLDVTR